VTAAVVLLALVHRAAVGGFRLCLRGGARTIDAMRGGRGKRVAVLAGVLALVILGPATWLSWPHLRFWRLFAPLGPNAQGYPEYRHRKTGIVFVSLPGGKFWMGAQKDDPKAPNYEPEAYPHEGPVHEVTLSPFLVGKFEVTQSQWERIMGTNPSDSKGADLPVETVFWEDCQEFCKRAGLKLPSEAQWEYACRAGTPGPYGGTGKLEDMGWCPENSGDKTHPVGQKQPNRFGLHDMHWNVWERCEDVFDDSFYARPEAAGLDPVCTSGSDNRVLRGGSFCNPDDFAHCAWRIGSPDDDAPIVGFRVVASPF
jgi:formylglycine-generating enzyme required for sulfatase activity